MPLIEFPDVPDVAGVPTLVRADDATALDQAAPDLAENYSDDAGSRPEWAIFKSDSDEQAIIPDTFVSVEPRFENEIANHPIERGQFASYNKVAKPASISVQMTCGGGRAQGSLSVGAQDRPSFLGALDDMVGDLNVYDIATRDFYYPEYNLVSYDYKRSSSSGVSLLTVNCRFQQVRITASATFTETAMPDGQQAQSAGQQGLQQPTRSQQAALSNANTGGATGQW